MGYDGTLKFDTSIDNSGFQTGLDKISGLASGAIKTTATILAGAATAAGALGTAAIKTGADFEAGMSKVQAISGASANDMVQLTEKAKEMGAKTKFSASESADAFQYMAMAGWKTKDMLGSIEGIMNLAAASGEDLASTSDIVTDAMTAFGLAADGTTTIVKDGLTKEVSNAAHFADVLAQSASNSNTNVSMLGESFKYVAPVAGSLGYSIEDTAIALGLMANQGIKASTAGTALRQLLTNLAKPTDTMAAAMDYLGISLQNSDGSMKSLQEIMNDLRASFGNCKMPMDEFQKQLQEIQTKYENGELTEKKYTKAVEDLTEKAYGAEGALKAKYAATLAGQQGMAGLLAIVNTSTEDYDKLTESIYNSDGAAQQMADTMNDNLQGAITLLKSALESVQIAFYEKVQTPMKETVKTITSMVDDMNQAFAKDGFKGLVDSFASSLAQLTQMALEAAPKLIEVAESMVKNFINAIMDHKEEFATAGATMVADLVTAIMDVAGDMWSAGIYLFTEFLQALAGHSEEMGQSFGQMLKQIGSAVRENMPLIIQAARDFVEGFCKGLSEEFPGVAALIEGFLKGCIDSASKIIEGITDVVSVLFDKLNEADPATLEKIGYAIGVIATSIYALKVAKTVTGGVKTLLSVLETAKSGISGVASVAGKLVEVFQLVAGGAGTLSEAVTAVFGTVGTMVAGVGSVIGGAALAITNFVDMFVNGFNAIKEVLMVVGIALAAVGAVILGVPAAVAGVVAAIIAAVSTLVVVLKEHWDQVVEFFQQLPEKLSELGSVISEWFSGVLEAVGEFAQSAIQWFSDLPEKIMEAISPFVEMLTEWGSNVLSTATEIVTQIVDAIVTFFSELPGKIADTISFVIDKLAEWGTNILTWISTNVPKFIENIVTFFSELPGKVWEWLVNTFNKLVDWGKQMLQKSSEVAKTCLDAIIKSFSQLPGKIWEWLSNAFSKLTTWGSNTVQKAREIGSNAIDAIVRFFSELPSRIWEHLTQAASNVASWGTDLAQKGSQAATYLVNAVTNGVAGLPNQMWSIGSNIVSGVWNGICSAAGWFSNSVYNFFSNIVRNAKNALGIHSPSKVFADEVGEWIPPGIGQGVEKKMPELYSQMDDEMESLGKRMQMAVNVETGKIAVDKNVNTTYKVVKEKQGVFESGDTTVEVTGETHVHVDLDGNEVGKAQTPIIDKNFARIDTHKKRGG